MSIGTRSVTLAVPMLLPLLAAAGFAHPAPQPPPELPASLCRARRMLQRRLRCSSGPWPSTRAGHEAAARSTVPGVSERDVQTQMEFAFFGAGASMSDLQKAAEDSLRRSGYLDKFIHGFGHFVGLNVHDAGADFPRKLEDVSVGGAGAALILSACARGEVSCFPSTRPQPDPPE